MGEDANAKTFGTFQMKGNQINRNVAERGGAYNTKCAHDESENMPEEIDGSDLTQLPDAILSQHLSDNFQVLSVHEKLLA